MARGSDTGRKRRGGERGVALLLALVFTAVLTALVFGFLYESQVTASLVQNSSADFEALLAAKSAAANGLSLLLDDLLETEMNGMPEVDSLLDPSGWASGLPFEPLNGAMMRTSISDECGKLNLNALISVSDDGQPVRNEELITALRSFFNLRSDSEGDPVDAIIDWLDYDDMDAEEPEGAENSYYMGLENPFPCKNGPMDAVEELLLIKGITADLYFGDPALEQLPLSEYLTVQGDWEGRVNVNTAREEVIAAVLGGYTGNEDIAVARQIYDEVQTQPYEDLNRLTGMLGPMMPADAALGADGKNPGAGRPATTDAITRATKQRTPESAAGAMKSAEKQIMPETSFGGGGGGRNTARKPATTPPGVVRPNTGTGTDLNNVTNPQLQDQLRQQNSVSRMFRVNSTTFRIHGDGMVGETLARVEAFVFRTPLDVSGLEQSASGTGGALAQAGNPVPLTPFRILDWKVIQ
ncbi:MAG: general secretion pathway protein GspK [Candidatus Hydrogenedentes bacterium]|nr:general secretion pathway protein GspK [Candidatus Hydrogenedentota bacterium]